MSEDSMLDCRLRQYSDVQLSTSILLVLKIYGIEETGADCYMWLVVKAYNSINMPKNSLFYTVDC